MKTWVKLLRNHLKAASAERITIGVLQYWFSSGQDAEDYQLEKAYVKYNKSAETVESAVSGLKDVIATYILPQYPDVSYLQLVNDKATVPYLAFQSYNFDQGNNFVTTLEVLRNFDPDKTYSDEEVAALKRRLPQSVFAALEINTKLAAPTPESGNNVGDGDGSGEDYTDIIIIAMAVILIVWILEV